MERRPSRRTLLRGGAAAAVGAVAGCPRPAGSSEVFEEDFEDRIDRWSTAASIGPEEPLPAFEWRVERSQARAAAGEWSLEVFTEGDHDDGTAWASAEVAPPSDADGFEVRLEAWSQSESFNTLRHLVAYLGPERPADEADFPDPGSNSTEVDDVPFGGLREPLHLAEGWREYTFEWRPDRVPDTLYVAAGVSVVWEADATHYLDEVRVTTL